MKRCVAWRRTTTQHFARPPKADGVVDRRPVTALLITFLLPLCVPSCNKDQQPPSPALPTGSADLLGSEILAPEGFSNETTQTAGQLILPTSFGRRTADLDQMLKKRNIRALVTINPISFFYSHGRPRGLLYEQLEQLERFVNKKYKTRRLKVKISFIPMRPDELGPALSQGVGDFVASWIVITPGRQKQYTFTAPIMTDVKQIIVTGPELANARGLDDLVGRDIYVSPLTSFYEHLAKLNEERVKARKAPLSVKPADQNLQEDDLIEMVNAGLIPATVAIQHRANLWE